MADNQNTWKRPDPNAKYTINQYLDVVNANNERVVAGLSLIHIWRCRRRG